MWLFINLLVFLGTPVGLAWGWIVWAKQNKEQRHTLRIQGLAAVCSAPMALVCFALGTFRPENRAG